MKTIEVAFGLALLTAALGSTANAQVQRSFVSSFGNDASPCTRAAPCRNFLQAVSQTNPGGELVVLDSGGYGSVTITKAISLISPPGVYAGITPLSGDGVKISAGQSDVITLRGLTINNHASSGSGINFVSGGTLHVESCVVSGFSSNAGLEFFGPGRLEVKDSIMKGNSQGIVVSSQTGTTASATIDNTRLEGNSFIGLQAGSGASVTIRGSVVSNNQTGLFAVTTPNSKADLDAESCVISGNSGDGVLANSLLGGVATILVSSSTVTANNIGLHNPGPPAQILSRLNNTIRRNSGGDEIGTITDWPAK